MGTDEGGELAAVAVMVTDGELVYRVLLSSGIERVHRYHVSAGTPSEEVMQLINDLVGKVAEAVSGRRTWLYLDNPATTYAAVHLVGVEFSTLGPAELAAEVERAHRQAGFRPAEEAGS